MSCASCLFLKTTTVSGKLSIFLRCRSHGLRLSSLYSQGKKKGKVETLVPDDEHALTHTDSLFFFFVFFFSFFSFSYHVPHLVTQSACLLCHHHSTQLEWARTTCVSCRKFHWARWRTDARGISITHIIFTSN